MVCLFQENSFYLTGVLCTVVEHLLYFFNLLCFATKSEEICIMQLPIGMHLAVSNFHPSFLSLIHQVFEQVGVVPRHCVVLDKIQRQEFKAS